MASRILGLLEALLPEPQGEVVPQVLCKKSLYKSTYLKNAFTKGKRYEFIREDDLVWIRDSMGREFSFARASAEKGRIPFNIFEDYFR